jgi:hypothetical protein
LSRGDSYIIPQAGAFVNTFFYFFLIFNGFSDGKNAATATGMKRNPSLCICRDRAAPFGFSLNL